MALTLAEPSPTVMSGSIPASATAWSLDDLLVHFHGAAPNQEKTVDEAELPAVVVRVNGGTGSSPDATRSRRPRLLRQRPEAHIAQIKGLDLRYRELRARGQGR